MSAERQIYEHLNGLHGTRTVIVGVGNTLKGDDGAGPLVCQKLQSAKISAEIIDAGTVPENFIQTIIKKKPQNLLIIDAVDFSASAGTIKVFEPEHLSSAAFSTHTLSPHLFIDMITKSIEVKIYFIGIQPAQVGFGRSVSTEVKQALDQLTAVLTGIFAPGTEKL